MIRSYSDTGKSVEIKKGLILRSEGLMRFKKAKGRFMEIMKSNFEIGKSVR